MDSEDTRPLGEVLLNDKQMARLAEVLRDTLEVNTDVAASYRTSVRLYANRGPEGEPALMVNGLYLHSNGGWATFPESQMLADEESIT